MSAYPTYKHSGIEWLGDIPEHWEVNRLKDFAKVENGKDYKHVEVEEGGYPVYGSGGKFRRSSEYIYNKPSVLLGRKGTIDKPLLVTEAFWTVDTMFYTDIHPRVDYRFFYYLCKTIQFDMYAYGSALPSMTQETLHAIKFCRPNFDEQTTIANYLDEKTSKLDQLISNKKEQIKKLKEIRQIEINTAVTKGLDSNVKLKPSGIEWIGDIPDHWEVKRLKDVLKFYNNVRIPLSSEIRGSMENKKYDYYGASGIIDKVEDYLFDGTYILIGEDGANLLARSSPLAFIAQGKFWVNNHAHILKPLGGNTIFNTFQLEMLDYTASVTGSAQPKLTLEALGIIKLLHPPKEEQTAIANYLDEKTSRIDKLVSNLENQIEKLEEVIKIEIYNAVTGKIKIA